MVDNKNVGPHLDKLGIRLVELLQGLEVHAAAAHQEAFGRDLPLVLHCSNCWQEGCQA